MLARLEAEHPAYPQLDAACYQRAWILESLGRDLEMRHSLLELVHRFPASKYRPDACWRLAERAALAGRTHDALKWADEILGDPSASQDLQAYARMLAGRMAAERGEWKSASQQWRELQQSAPQHPLAVQAEFWLAESAFQSQCYDEAIQRFRSLPLSHDDRNVRRHAAAPLRIAQAQAHQRKWSEALQTLQDHFGAWSDVLDASDGHAASTATAVSRRDAEQTWLIEVDYLKGRCLASLGRFEEARSSYLAALRSPGAAENETAAKARWMIGETYFHQRRYADAIDSYHLVEMEHSFARWQALALLQAGKCHEQLQQSEQARQLWRQLLQDYPETTAAVDATRLLGQVRPATTRQARLPKEQP